MAKFSFRLQSVLNLKDRLEQQQRNIFSQTKRRLDEEIDKLNVLCTRLEEYESEGKRMREDSLKVLDILENQEAILRIKEFIDEQNAQVKLWEMRLEEERVKLVEIMQERKMYERLREKAFETYLEEEKHSEAVENDEHNSFVYGTREA